MITSRESESGRRGLFAIFFAFAVPFALGGLVLAGWTSCLALGPGLEPIEQMGLGYLIGFCVLLLGVTACGACFGSLLATGKGEVRLVRVLWVVVALTTGMLTVAALFA